MVAGNHDWLFQREPARARGLRRHATYQQDAGAVVGGLRVWGSPWQPRGPRALQAADGWSAHVGCEELRVTVERVAPGLHVFGHIHEAHGCERHGPSQFVNAANCDRAYRPVQTPVVVTID